MDAKVGENTRLKTFHGKYVISTVCYIYSMLYLQYIYSMLYLQYVISTVCYIYSMLYLQYVISTVCLLVFLLRIILYDVIEKKCHMLK